MSRMTTIEVPEEVRDQVRDAAVEEHMTQGQLITELLRQRRKALFWDRLERETPDQEYLHSLNEADAAFIDDAAQTAPGQRPRTKRSPW